MHLTQQLIRLARVSVAVAALLGVAAGTAYAATTIDGLTQPTLLLSGGANATITTTVHNSRDYVVTSSPVGVSVHPWVHVGGASGTATGGVSIRRWSNGTCAGSEDAGAGGALVNGTLNFTTFSITPTDGSVMSYRAYYTGDYVYDAKTGACTAVTITKADPVLILQMRNVDNDPVNTAYLGMDIHAFVDVNGRVDEPTGTVKVYRWNGSSCSGGASIVGPYTLSGGQVNTPYQWHMDTLGTFAYRATYQGDSTYNAFSSPCLVIQTTKWPVNLHTEIHNRVHVAITHSSYSEQVHVAATLSGNAGAPTGQATVKRYPNDDCTGSPNVNVTIPVAPVMDPAGPDPYDQPPSVWSWQLVYMGDATYAMTAGPCMTVSLKSTPSFEITVHNTSHDPITSMTLGKTAHLKIVTAIALFGSPTGDLTAKWYANGQCSGTAKPVGTSTMVNGAIDDKSLDFKPTKTGTYSFQATFAGDGTYYPYHTSCATLNVVAAPVVTPKPTSTPSAPAVTPQPTQAAVASLEPAASDAPVSTDQPAPSPAPSHAPEATGAPATAGAPDSTRAPAASEGSGTTDPLTPSGDGGPGTGWILLLGLILLLVLGAGYVYSRRTGEPKKA